VKENVPNFVVLIVFNIEPVLTINMVDADGYKYETNVPAKVV